MPQKTNLNISPYYDDFNKEDNFYKVLFKPGQPVQARELTTLQSQFQNQIESFGSHIFKEGSMVIPGNINYDNQYYSVRVNENHLGIPVALYLDKLIGLRLRGEKSGIILSIDSYQNVGYETDVSDLTIYVQYLESGDDNSISELTDGEQLIVEESFVYGNTPVNEGETVLNLVSSNASAIGSAVGIQAGVYFIRGTFVDVATDKIVLDPYSNDPSYRVGLNINEEIITAKDDPSLYDNARGFSNYAAPGADRFKITTTLGKKALSDFNDTNFVEILRVDEGEVKKLINKTQYSIIKDYFAQRTFDESGNYSVDPFDVKVSNSLNDGISNEGVFRSTEITDQGNIPTDDLMAIKVSAGKAYVKGYDIERNGTSIIDVDKPRDKEVVDTSLVPYSMGTVLRVNNVFGTPAPNINDDSEFIQFYSRRRTTNNSGTGELIGKARVYNCAVSNASYVNGASEWDLRLFDIHTYTRIETTNAFSNTQLPDGSYVRGVSSGATGYSITAGGGGTVVKLCQVSGKFVNGEQIVINEDSEITRTISAVKIYGVQDIKSVWQNASTITGYSADFVADTVLQSTMPTGFNITDTLNINATGIATCAGKSFAGIKTDTIVRYQVPGENAERFNRITEINSTGTQITLATVPDVSGVCNGGLPNVATGVSPKFAFGVPTINSNETKGLYAPLGANNISDVNLSNSTLVVSTNITGETTNGAGQCSIDIAASGISSAFYENFDAERYTVTYSNGSIEDLTADQFTLGANGQSVTIEGLTANQTNVIVSSTLKKKSIKSKQKDYIRSTRLNVTKTAVGVNTSLTDMTKDSAYGMRVEDKEISLNVPDVSNIVGVFESFDTNLPTLDRLVFMNGLALTTNAILGEKVTGSSTDAVAQITRLNSATEIEIAYLTPARFVVGENINFEESNLNSPLQDITHGAYLNITHKFELDKGQREQFYDYSRLVRRENYPPPTRKLVVVFDNYVVPSNDKGELYTVESYDDERFGNAVPHLANGLRASDTIDFRPRVVPFTGSGSPFSFHNRDFGATGNVNPSFIVTPNESSLLGYSYYLPRIDKVSFDTQGNLSVIKGTSSVEPTPPPDVVNAMTIATISLPPYLYDPQDARITLVDNLRYTMRDIGELEDRIQNLEVLTSLSLLELDTKTLQVQDVDGLSRFKTGFFVDDFKNSNLLDRSNPDCKCDVDTETQELNVPLDFWSLKPEIALALNYNTDTVDYSQNLDLLDQNVRKSGDLVTLAYTEKGWIDQPLASRVENVNPFNMIEFIGTIDLQPAQDSWVRSVELQGGVRVVTGRARGMWGLVRALVSRGGLGVANSSDQGSAEGNALWADSREQIVSDVQRSRGRVTGSFVEQIHTSSLPDTHIRSRNVGFEASGLRPVARFYPFFDSTSGIDVIPKLLEVIMTNGIFQVGEVVDAYAPGGQHTATFRLCTPYHKKGTYNATNPDLTYNANPYDTTSSLGTAYSASASVLNVDINALTDEAQGRFYGYIPPGNDVVLLGRTSGAQAKVDNLRLVADTYGDLYGAFWFRDPLTSPPPPLRFRTGTSTFKLTSSATNAENLPGSLLICSGETTYTATGIVNTFTNNLVIVRRPRRRCDPLAQSFTTDETGAFLTAVDIYMGNKDPNEKLTIEVRTVELGTPTLDLVTNYARVVLDPSQINTSPTAEIPTKVIFPSPVYLEPNTEYAIVLLAPSSNLFDAWIAQMGERTVNTQSLPDAEAVMVTRQYVGGSLFKSQNGTIWSASQFEDLKFKLYKAEFTTTPGTAYFYNPELKTNTGNIERLLPNAVTCLPRKLKVGITTTSHAATMANLSAGVQVTDGTSDTAIQGYIERSGGPISTFGVSNGGSGYNAGQTFNNVPVYSITGNGTGATFTIVINSDGAIASGSLTSNTGGEGYRTGDLLGITTSSVLKGTGGTLSVVATSGTGTLYLTNVQGEEFTSGQDLVYYSGANKVTLLTTSITSSAVYDDLYDGNVIEVQQYNHGMTADTNVVTLADIEPNTDPIIVTDSVAADAQVISIANTTPFATFNGISTSSGYVKINSEIIYYNSVTTNQLGIGTRGIDGTTVRTHNTNDLAYKYELNGLSLKNINTTHNMPNNATLKANKDIDKYYLQVSRGDKTSGDSQISFTQEGSGGGENIFASQNFQYDRIIPQFNLFAPSDETTFEAQARSVSGTSAGGGEVSFLDQGYENITLNQPNKLSTPRLVCSRINETTRLTTLPKNRSSTVSVKMQTTDKNLSPVINLTNGTIVYQRSRLNSPVLDYIKDGRSERDSGDPHAAVYISQRVDLRNSATSLKVLVAAYRDSSADFRVLYQLFRPDGSDGEQTYNLFPGYDNLRDTDGDGFGDEVIDITKNSGRADAFVPSSRDNEFLEYQFSIDDLEEFDGFRIKIVVSGTNEAKAPRFQDFRAVALA